MRRKVGPSPTRDAATNADSIPAPPASMIETRSRYAERDVRISRRFTFARERNCKMGNINPVTASAAEAISRIGSGIAEPAAVVAMYITKGIAPHIDAYINRSVVIRATEL